MWTKEKPIEQGFYWVIDSDSQMNLIELSGGEMRTIVYLIPDAGEEPNWDGYYDFLAWKKMERPDYPDWIKWQ